jgi:hypothetical protein
MDRRTFLASGAALAITVTGGCTGCARSPTASMEMTPVDDVDVAERATSDLLGREEGEEPDEPTDPRRVVRAAVENGSTTVRWTDPRVPADEPFVADGTVYELGRAVVDSQPATTFGFTLNPVEGDVAADETVRWEALPAVDREKLAEHGLDGPDPFLGFGSSLLYTADELSASELVPEPVHPVVVWGPETRGRIEIDEGHETPLRTYRIEARVVEESAAAYGRRLRERYAFELSGLTSGEREIVEEADGGTGYVVPPDESAPPALSRLAARFANHEGLHADGDEPSASGTYLVRYEGLVYWTTFHVDPDALSATPAG